MKNLVLLKNIQHNFGVKNAKLITCDTLNQVVYFATETSVTGYSLDTNQVSSVISLLDNDHLEGGGADRIISLHYLFDQDSISIATTKGDLLIWQPEMNALECVGSVDAGFTCAEWSPDQELLVLTTGNGTLVLMTKDFDPLYEYPIHTKDFGEAEPITVGWGKKETQFHGSAGKEAAKQKRAESVVPILSWDDRRTEISWRGDGQFFAITSVDQNTDCRYLRVFDRDGKLQATNEIVEGLENCICWRPSGNLIASSQRKPNKHDVIFFEKNGLQHGEFALPFGRDEKKIIQISWNTSSDILAIVFQSMVDHNNKTVQLWTVGNYHWYLKQETNFTESNRFACMMWDPEDSYSLHMITEDGVYTRKKYLYDVVRSKGENNLSMVAVIDGDKLLLTPFKLMVVPPPMATHTVQLDSSIQMLSFGLNEEQHDLISHLSNGVFAIIRYASEGKYGVEALNMDEGLTQYSLRHLLWLQSDLFAVVADHENGNSILILKLEKSSGNNKLIISYKIDVLESIHVLFMSEDSQHSLFIEDSSGNIYQITQGPAGYCVSEKQCTLPQVCSYVTCRNIDGNNIVFGLTNHHRLFMNEKEIANNCTSFLLHDEFLLLTTHSHTLRSIYLSSLAQNNKIDLQDCSYCFDESIRRVERGSKLVTAVQQGTLVVLQMPRGNLESIHPRALTVTYLQKLLSNLEYRKATEVMRKNRINLNLIYDHDPQLFLNNIDKFVSDVQSVNHINLFLADLISENVCSSLYHPYYHHGENKQKQHKHLAADRSMVSSTKVDVICETVRKAIERNGSDRYLLALLTTYAKQSQPDLESVLMKIKCLKDHPPNVSDKSSITYEKALNYILYLVDVDKLFDISLGLYDFDMVIMVAEKSQKDPKEYLPFLNNFKNMEVNYRKYSIDKYLKKYSKALMHLAKCEDRFDECIDFVKEQRLHKEALKLFPKTSEKYKKISYGYGEYLRQQKLYEDAGLVFSRSGFHKEALAAFTHTTNWHMVLREAKVLNYSAEDMMTLCRELSAKLKSSHMFDEAALLLEIYVKDVEESVVCLLEGGLWFRALQLVQQYDRADLEETNIKPAIDEQYDQAIERIDDLKTRFDKHKERLKVVIEKKEREAYEILEGIRDDPENDLYSDTSSITGQSVSSIGSSSSKGSRSSGHSRKSRNKVGRKKYKLREGSKHEDFALREALAEIVGVADKMKNEVNGLLKILVFYFNEEKALRLQADYSALLDLIESNMKEIWSNDKTGQAATATFGPDATVQSILAQRQNFADTTVASDDQLPEPTRPTLRSNIHWKVHLLRT